MSETLLDDGVSGIDLERRCQFLGGLGHQAGKGITFGSLDQRANQLGAQCSRLFDDCSILRGVTRSFFILCKRLIEAPRCLGFVAPLNGLLRTFGVGAHHCGLELRW